ncbi:hypothetical protein AB9F45_38115, partial [Rhizobium leguminosarum]
MSMPLPVMRLTGSEPLQVTKASLPRAPDLIEQVRAASGGYGVDAALDTSNNEGATAVVLELLRARG